MALDLSRVSTLMRDIDIAILSVRLSVCHVPVFYGNALTYCQFLHHTVASHSSFMSIKHVREIPTGSLPAGALSTGVVYKYLAIFDHKSLYLATDTR